MSVQLENGYIRIANDLWDEILRRDFTKRQKDILLFIWRLSYGCQNKEAIIPRLKDFSLCGVGSTHITAELKYLETMKVITWDKEQTKFSINKDYETWQVTPVRGWDDDSFKDLIHLNISNKSYQNSKLPKQEVTETVIGKLPKQELFDPTDPYAVRDEEVSKDSIKDIKDLQEEEKEEKPILTAADAYFFSFKKRDYTGHIQGYIVELSRRGFKDPFIREIFLAMGEYGASPDVNYMRKMSEDWIKSGIYTLVEAKARREKSKDIKAVPDIPKRTNSQIESRHIEIARGRWIDSGGNPNEFVYDGRKSIPV